MAKNYFAYGVYLAVNITLVSVFARLWFFSQYLWLNAKSRAVTAESYLSVNLFVLSSLSVCLLCTDGMRIYIFLLCTLDIIIFCLVAQKINNSECAERWGRGGCKQRLAALAQFRRRTIILLEMHFSIIQSAPAYLRITRDVTKV